ncbi:MAG: hypothetical protein Q4F57_01160 [Weeksellaceae bacterium]|nr:hypothetical protein [Weeksellaceae bacterium]
MKKLTEIYDYILAHEESLCMEYQTPQFWQLDGSTSRTFADFYRLNLQWILGFSQPNIDYSKSISYQRETISGRGGDWSYQSRAYNCFVRYALAYDHDADGKLGDTKGINTLHGYRETGTLLKTIALLPHLKKLNCNVLHLMPIQQYSTDSAINQSPYAIKDQYAIDSSLAEPLLPFTAEHLFAALIEACHILDIRVVLETVLRTASLDSVWVKSNPEWFYWIDAEHAEKFDKPTFTSTQLESLEHIPQGKSPYIEPDEEYQSQFHAPPKPQDIYWQDNQWFAKSGDKTLTIPHAFADWPPDDKQSPWTDVTYLRMYTDSHDKYNYMAYNTLRYYDPALATPENRVHDLWETLCEILPYYIENYGLDGVMLDMGHALPTELLQEIIDRARFSDPDFGFWEENFDISAESRQIGFNATLGFQFRNTGQESTGLRSILHTAAKILPMPFFGTPETHNTPRIAAKTGILAAKQYWVLNNFIPSCIPYIHNGIELLETQPVNLGLSFTPQDQETYPREELPLFSLKAMHWDTTPEFREFMTRITLLRARNEFWIAHGDERTLINHYPTCSFDQIVAFERFDITQPWKSILIFMNTNYHQSEKFFMEIHGTYNNTYTEFLSGKAYTFDNHWVYAELKPGQILIFELHKLL